MTEPRQTTEHGSWAYRTERFVSRELIKGQMREVTNVVFHRDYWIPAWHVAADGVWRQMP